MAGDDGSSKKDPEKEKEKEKSPCKRQRQVTPGTSYPLTRKSVCCGLLLL